MLSLSYAESVLLVEKFALFGNSVSIQNEIEIEVFTAKLCTRPREKKTIVSLLSLSRRRVQCFVLSLVFWYQIKGVLFH